MAQPLVSVLMACRNNTPFLEEAMDSILGQTYPHLELVAVDDASDDDTAAVLERYAERHPERVRIARNERQSGIPAVRTRCLSMARGSLIALLDGDDVWLSHKLARQVEVLARNPRACLVHGRYEAFDSDSGRTLPWDRYDGPREGDVLAELFVDGCFIMTGTVLIRRLAMDARAIAFEDLGLLSYDDFFLYLVLSLDRPVAFLDEVVMRYRRHGENLTERLFADNVHRRRITLLEEFLRRYPEARGRLGLRRREGLARHWVSAAALERASGRPAQATGCLARAAREDPRVAARAILGLAERTLRGRARVAATSR